MRQCAPRPLAGRPRVSVVIPCYNYGRFLPDAVHSALAQPGLDREIIVVDDCSTDGSDLVAKQLEADHPEVRLIRNERNRGHIATYNIGLSQAVGDYVSLLSADDVLVPGALTRAAALFEAHPGVGLVYGHAPSFGEGQGPPAAAPPRSWSVWGGEEWIRRVARRGDNVIVNPEAVLRRDVLEALGGYDSGHPHAADMLLWLRAATRADVGRVNATQACYREHGDNMHRTDFAGIRTDLQHRLEVYRALAVELADTGRGRLATDLLAAAGRATAREALLRACLGLDSGSGGATPQQDVDAFARLAAEACPHVASSWLWSSCRRSVDGPLGPPSRHALALAYDLRWRIRSRRWRRWGI